MFFCQTFCLLIDFQLPLVIAAVLINKLQRASLIICDPPFPVDGGNSAFISRFKECAFEMINVFIKLHGMGLKIKAEVGV